MATALAILDASRFAPANRRRLSGPGLRTFLAIADLWGLSERERLLVLGLPSRSTYYRWGKAAREHREFTLDVDRLTRISAVLGIHQALGVLHNSEVEWVAWLRGLHTAPVFGGQAPISLVTSGTLDGLMLVRRFLDAACGGCKFRSIPSLSQPSTQAPRAARVKSSDEPDELDELDGGAHFAE